MQRAANGPGALGGQSDCDWIDVQGGGKETACKGMSVKGAGQ